MLAVLRSLAMFIVDLFKSRRRLEAENLFLRHQLSIALRRAPPRLRLRGSDRALLVWMTRLWPSLLGAAQVVQPETILRWHRAGFTAFWRWKSRKRAGRPKIDRELRDLIQQMSRFKSLLSIANGRTHSPPRGRDHFWISMQRHMHAASPPKPCVPRCFEQELSRVTSDRHDRHDRHLPLYPNGLVVTVPVAVGVTVL